MIDVSQINLRRILNSELAAIAEEVTRDSASRTTYIDFLVDDLATYEHDGYLDEETLYIIGLRHYNAFDQNVLHVINAQIAKRVPPPISTFFLAGSHTTNKRDAVSSHPLNPAAYASEAPRRHDSLITKIRRLSLPQWRQDFENFFSFHQSFARHTGDAELLVRSFGSIAANIFENATKENKSAVVRLVERLVLEGLRWEPENHFLWCFWAQAYALNGDMESAELIFWETIRRHPHNIVGRNMFAEWLSEHRGRNVDAIQVSRESLDMDANAPITMNALAKYLLSRGEKSDISEAIDLLLKALQKGNPYTTSLLARAIAASSAVGTIDEQVEIVARSPLVKPALLGHVAMLLVRTAGALESAKLLLETAIKRFSNDPALYNQLAKVVVNESQTGSTDRAIAILRKVIAEMEDNVYSRNQLAQYLLVKGDSASISEAVELLDDTEKMFGVTRYTREIRQAIADPVKASRLIKLPAPKGTAKGLLSFPPIDPTSSKGSLTAVPAFVAKWGEMRRLRFLVERGGPNQKEFGKNRVKEILATNPTFAYAQILAERYSIWVEGVKRLPTFAVAFESALSNRDVRALQELSRTYPRLEALTMVCRAMFGDIDAAERIADVLSGSHSRHNEVIMALRTAISPIISISEEPAEIIKSLVRSERVVIDALRNANEATVKEFALAA